MKKITKLMLTLTLLLVGVTGANAAWERVYKIDYSNYTSFPFYVMEFTPEWVDGIMHDQGSSGWHQYFIADGIPTEVGKSYTVKAMVKASENINVNINMGWGWGNGEKVSVEANIPGSDDFKEVVWEYTGEKVPNGTSCNLVAQPWKGEVTIDWKSVEVGYYTDDPEPEWTDLIVNGNMEGTSSECFYLTEQGVGGPFLAPILEGIGKDGSKGIKVESYNNPAYSWDTQFFIRLPYKLPAGTKYKVSFDYKASNAGGFETQAHSEPGTYIHSSCIGSGNFSTEWKSFDGQGTISTDQSKEDKMMQTIAFNLGLNGKATKFYFDNVKFEVLADVAATLTPNPATNPETYPEPITSMDIVGTFPGLDWDPTAGWDMVQSEADEAVWTLSKVLDIPASTDGPTTTYKYKATANDVWTRYSLPNGDDATIEFGTDEHPFGKYNLTFTANVKTHTLTLDAEEIYTMTAAGDNTTLFGTTWNAENTANDLTKNEDGTFSITYESKDLTEGNIKFKVVKNHSWDVASYPADNYVLNIPRSSNYDVTITFNPENKEVVATIKDNGVVSSYYLVGGEKDAAWTVGDVLTKDEDVYSIEIPYSSEYSFAIAPNTALNDNKDMVVNWNIVIRPESQTEVKFANNSGTGVASSEGIQNWKMKALSDNESQSYTTLLTYNPETKAWTTSATSTVTISAAGYATYSNAEKFEVAEGPEVYIVKDASTSVKLTEPDSRVLPGDRGAGIILKGSGDVTIKSVDADAETANVTGNLLVGSCDWSYTFPGDYSNIYILANGNSGVGFYPWDTNATGDEAKLAAHKAFLVDSSGARGFIGFDDGETTAIEGIAAEKINNGDVYNLNGQRVAQPTKGLYIVNGKKVIVK